MIAVTGIASLDIPAALAAARRRIVLHAAIYGNFADSPTHAAALETALSHPDFGGLDVVSIRPETEGRAMRDFLDALREGWTPEAMAEHVARSREFLHGLARRHPGRVRLYETARPGLFPALIIDDDIHFGHYARSPIPAPEGFWFHVHADVERLSAWLRSGNIPPHATADERAALRIVSECLRAMDESAPATREDISA
ncbi:hypothetical protein GGQ74_001831 [Desulfobaculum xiamenense]|uniref:Uncharacterized protein n=1 Tax=Desulfobaculum xiamenense TaxID=995050 RepID=A0A846QIU3_9BACT|nr:hypothetical protein [Desulfobaculum xiamenense]NJB68158.1 hypothetical protein [Desulfobaculum xiamenense]